MANRDTLPRYRDEEDEGFEGFDDEEYKQLMLFEERQKMLKIPPRKYPLGAKSKKKIRINPWYNPLEDLDREEDPVEQSLAEKRKLREHSVFPISPPAGYVKRAGDNRYADESIDYSFIQKQSSHWKVPRFVIEKLMLRERKLMSRKIPDHEKPLFLLRKKAKEKYSRHEKDCGSSEVQIAMMTERILHITQHLMKNHKDIYTKRRLDAIISKRKRLLIYLHRTKPIVAKKIATDLGLKIPTPLAHYQRSVRYRIFNNKKKIIKTTKTQELQKKITDIKELIQAGGKQSGLQNPLLTGNKRKKFIAKQEKAKDEKRKAKQQSQQHGTSSSTISTGTTTHASKQPNQSQHQQQQSQQPTKNKNNSNGQSKGQE
jgi:ribosomal protein S15